MSKRNLLLGFFWILTFVFLVGSIYYYFSVVKPAENTNFKEPVIDLQKNNFISGAKIILQAAINQYQLETNNENIREYDLLINDSNEANGFCYGLFETGIAAVGNYHGHVIVKIDVQIGPFFYLTLADDNYEMSYTTLNMLENNQAYIQKRTNSINIDLCPTEVVQID